MFEPRDRGVGGGQREEEIEVAIEDGGGWKGNPHPSFRKGRGGGRRGTTSVSLCIFWHKAELTSRRKWWRSSLVHGAFNGLILRPNFISFPPGSRKVFRRSSIIPLTLPALLSTGIRVINYQSASTSTTSSELQM